jgi:hypothetical protein
MNNSRTSLVTSDSEQNVSIIFSQISKKDISIRK